MPNDPKWRVIARKSGQSIGNVIAVYTHMMVCASQAEDRGNLDGWDDEDIAAALDLEPVDIAAVRDAMQGKVLDGDHLKGWSKRQPKRERDDTSTDRVRKHREAKKNQQDTSGVTDDAEPCNAMKRHETPRNAQIREEEIREDSSVDKSTDASASPDPVKVAFDAGVRLLTSGGQSERNARALIGKWRKEHGDEAVFGAMSRAQNATEPVSFITRCLKPRDGPKRQWREAV
jgi:transcription elongation GreA/GreB family factor